MLSFCMYYTKPPEIDSDDVNNFGFPLLSLVWETNHVIEKLTNIILKCT